MLSDRVGIRANLRIASHRTGSPALLIEPLALTQAVPQARFQPFKALLINSLELLAIANIIITVWLAVLLTVAGDTLKEARRIWVRVMMNPERRC